MEPKIVEAIKNKHPKKNGWIKYDLNIGDWFVLILVIWQLFYSIYYYFNYLGHDKRAMVLFCLSFLLLLICFIGLIGFRNIWYLLFIGSVLGSLSLISFPVRKDSAKIDLLFTEVSKSKSGFPQILTQDISNKGPKYFHWVYLNIDSSSFLLYKLDGSNLLCRNYPNDQGWVFSQEYQVSNILFGSSKSPQIEKEKELLKIKDKLKYLNSK
jgi:hypothetical protein